MILRLVFRLAAWLLTMGLTLYLAAGDPSWDAAWGLLVINAVLALPLGLWLAIRFPALVAQGLGSPGDAARPARERLILFAAFAAFYVWLGVMGLDVGRLHWSRGPQSLQGVGVLALATAYGLAWRAFAALAGRRLADTGPYRVIRHPIHAAAAAFILGVPLLLGSWWGLALAPVFIVVLVWRLLRQERLSKVALPGYADYLAQVRYRLAPRLW